MVAPRGWYCFGYYGSNGTFLILSPDPSVKKDSLGDLEIPGLSGPAIQISFSDRETSGRFDIAQVAARIFPSEKAFVQNVIAEGIEPAKNFPSGPYPKDVLTRRSINDIEFETPANSNGMGTVSRLPKNGYPIMGEAIIGAGGLVLIDIRLPTNLSYLTPFILNATKPASLAAAETPE